MENKNKYTSPESYVMNELESAQHQLTLARANIIDLMQKLNRADERIETARNILNPEAHRFGKDPDYCSIDMHANGTAFIVMKASNPQLYQLLLDVFELHEPTVDEWNGRAEALATITQEDETTAAEAATDGENGTTESEVNG